MIRKSLVVSILALTALAACTATEGVKPDANITSSFTRGVTTESDVEAKLGKPLKSVTNNDGTSTVTFHYGEAQIGAGILIGMASGKDIITVVNFDRHGNYLSLTQETDNR